jgi:hypothetical protein
MDIEKAAWDYLNSEPEAPKKEPTEKKRTRNALMHSYESWRAKYIKEKQIVDSIIDEANRLKKNYDKHDKIMKEYHEKMKELREKIFELDDSGKLYTNMYKKPEQEEPLPTEEELENLTSNY